MFNWASSQLERLTEAVAPPPDNAQGRFVYLIQRNDEEGAMECLNEIPDPLNTIMQASKGMYAIHLACAQGSDRIIRYLLSQPGASIVIVDLVGNTPLHHACMNSNIASIQTVRMLITEFGASVVAKNGNGKTPYDVAATDGARQYLLPLQLQQETQYALANGGVGLIPGMDLGGLRIQNSQMAPPPIAGSGMGMPAPPMNGGMGMPAPPMNGGMGIPAPPIGGMSAPSVPMTPSTHHTQTNYTQPNAPTMTETTPNQMASPPSSSPSSYATPPGSVAALSQQHQPPSSGTYPPAAPSSGNRHTYARTGSSTLSLKGFRKPDGFHSSSSDTSLQQKYGNVDIVPGVTPTAALPPPPPTSITPSSAPSSGGDNPYAGGGLRGRYPTSHAYNNNTSNMNTNTGAAAPGSGGYNHYAGNIPTPPHSGTFSTPHSGNFTMFNPGAATPTTAAAVTQYPAHQATAPITTAPIQSFGMPPAPFSHQPQQSPYHPPLQTAAVAEVPTQSYGVPPVQQQEAPQQAPYQPVQQVPTAAQPFGIPPTPIYQQPMMQHQPSPQQMPHSPVDAAAPNFPAQSVPGVTAETTFATLAHVHQPSVQDLFATPSTVDRSDPNPAYSSSGYTGGAPPVTTNAQGVIDVSAAPAVSPLPIPAPAPYSTGFATTSFSSNEDAQNVFDAPAAAVATVSSSTIPALAPYSGGFSTTSGSSSAENLFASPSLTKELELPKPALAETRTVTEETQRTASEASAEELFGASTPVLDSTPPKQQPLPVDHATDTANTFPVPPTSSSRMPTAAVQENANGRSQSPVLEDDGMTEVPLSPTKEVEPFPNATQIPQIAPQAQTDHSAPPSNVEESLCSAIGLPPPPFRSSS